MFTRHSQGPKLMRELQFWGEIFVLSSTSVHLEIGYSSLLVIVCQLNPYSGIVHLECVTSESD